jgi:DMSO/TMAO reductase YedYZ molybdopterin-dependent catalytic subunit
MIDHRKFLTNNPENSETPLEAVCSWVTPTRLFFVRNHAQVPELDSNSWRLRLDGLVTQPLEFSYQQLLSMPQRTVSATLECAGNGRSFLASPVHGVQWGAGAIAHAEWSGVPLMYLLEKAGVQTKAEELIFEGADQCTEADHPQPMAFARSLPLAKAQHPDTLIALRMNGEALEPAHGFPARLLVPGWYGVASVKWVSRITATDEPFQGYYQSKKYTYQRRVAGGTQPAIVQQMSVKSEIIRPLPDETLPAGTQRIVGVAWAGEDAVARVEVSTDGGASWVDASLVGPRSAYSWITWEYLWEEMRPGDYTILARATSSRGIQQPMTHDALRGGYMISFVRPRPVRISPATAASPVATSGDPQTLMYDMNAFAERNARLPLDVEIEFIAGAGI